MAGWGNGRAPRALTLLAVTAGAIALAASPAAGMRSEKIAPHLCKTVNGGRFVGIPSFPGERIDRRLLPDIRWMKRRFDVFITDGYSLDPAHARRGEHPIGLATDIVPNRAVGGSWREIGELARRAEPKQDQPRPPWRWVGWNGDPGHGRGKHLHLSWMHSPTRPRDPARVVYTRKCPVAPDEPASKPQTSTSTGGTNPSGGGDSTGGISPKLAAKIAPPVPET